RPPRDYAALAGMIGREREEYEGLAPGPQRLARAEIDRELALRNELPRAAGELAAEDTPGTVGRGERREAARALQEVLRRRMRDRGEKLPGSQTTWLDAWSRRARLSERDQRDSPVMRDAREVQRRRKRQLGRDQPRAPGVARAGIRAGAECGTFARADCRVRRPLPAHGTYAVPRPRRGGAVCSDGAFPPRRAHRWLGGCGGLERRMGSRRCGWRLAACTPRHTARA